MSRSVSYVGYSTGFSSTPVTVSFLPGAEGWDEIGATGSGGRSITKMDKL